MNRKWRWFALIAVFALVAAACGDGDGTATTEPGETTTTAEGATTTEPEVVGPTGTARIYNAEPRTLNPPDANDSPSIRVLKALFSPLVGVDQDLEPFMFAAESVETADNGTTWEIVIKDGWTFHDGTPVTAQSYVDSWNYAAFGPNAQTNSGFFSQIAGYDELQCGTTTEPDPETGEDVTVADCEDQPPAAEAMSGLVVDSETQFTVTLGTAESFFPIRLVYPAYYPLPDAFYEDPAAFNEMPIGNGPFMMAEPWSHNVSVVATAYADYGGDDHAQIETLEFVIYDDVNTAINDLLAGNIDIHYSLPPERYAEVAASVNVATAASSSINYLGIPYFLPDLGGPENRDLRAALSLAIDQAAITEAIFDGRRQPAYNLLAPVIPGYQEHVCDAWGFDPDAAKALYDSTDGIPAGMTIHFNAGAGHEEWVEAVVNQWAENLGIDPADVQFEGYTLFGEYLDIMDNRGLDGPFRLGWGMDYPHPQNYLQLLLDSRFFGDAGGANATFYVNPAYDAKLDEALAIFDLNDAIPVYQEAMAIACEDVPLIPMFYGQQDYGWNDTVANVTVDVFNIEEYTSITAN